MRLRKDQFSPGTFYHVYNHASQGRLLFRSPEDYDFCLCLIKRFLPQDLFSLGAYCLMPNHYHILLRQLTEEPLTQAFFRIWNRYAKYYNSKYKSYGSVFCQKLQHVPIEKDQYLYQLIPYIHLNPVKAELADSPEAWPWSDCRFWIDQQSVEGFDSRLRDMFFNPKEYRDWLRELTEIKLQSKLLIDG